MKRVIKFRGKRKDNGEWVIGDLAVYRTPDKGEEAVISSDIFEAAIVNPDTVGQYIGLTDINGKKIYEGDIIKWLRHRTDGTGYIEVGRIEFRTEEQAVVVINKFPTQDGRESVRRILNCQDNMCVVGNIHDNPELVNL